MAEMTTAQKQALGGMNISSDEEKLEELKAIEAKIKAEEARIKANIAAKKAAEANAQADAQLIAQANAVTAATAQGLKGQRDEDGNLIPALDEQMAGFTEEESEVSKIDIADIKAIDFEEPIKLKTLVTTREELDALTEARKSNRGLDDRNEAKVQALADKYGMNIVELITSPEWQSVYGDKYNDMFLEVNVIKSGEDEVEADAEAKWQELMDEDEVVEADAEAKWQELMDIDQNIRTDEMSEKMRHGGIDPEQGRTKPVESDARSEKPGWEMAEGGNTWSINEKDDYWKTEEGFDEAMNLYGQKPSWLKEPTLVYNPETDEYEEIEEEEFEDLSRPAVSAEVKKLFG